MIKLKFSLEKIDIKDENTYCYNCGKSHFHVDIANNIICNECNQVLKCNIEVDDSMLENIEETAKYFTSTGGSVIINHNIGYISIERKDDTWYFDGDDYIQMIRQVPLNVNEEDFFAWSCQGW